MNTARRTYTLDLGYGQWVIRDLRGEEGLNRPFRFEVTFVDEERRCEAPALLRSEGVLRILSGEATDRAIRALVTSARVTFSRTGAREVTCTLEPRLGLLSRGEDIRVFCDRSTPEIVGELLREAGIDHGFQLADAYERRSYCVQHRESTLDFLHRLLEDDGIWYRLDDDGHVRFADRAAGYVPVPGAFDLALRTAEGMEHEDCVTSLEEACRLAPRTIELRDFNPEHTQRTMRKGRPGAAAAGGRSPDAPRLPMDVAAEVPGSEGLPEGLRDYDYPGEYLEPEQGVRKARLIAEATAIEADRLRGTAHCGRLAPGRTFRLRGGPGDGPEELCVLALVHEASHLTNVSQRFEAIPAETTYRPPRITKVPRMLSPLTAFVTGPPGEDIHTDAWGRAKIRFHWDRLQPADDRTSHWVPVMQDNTGQSSAPLRVGWEVLVHFLEGDPDRPVVLGRVYNGGDPPPLLTPLNKMQTQLASVRSPGRDGHNILRFDDRAGSEVMYVHAERDMRLTVANDRQTLIARTATHVVNRDERTTIGRDSAISVGESYDRGVGRDQSVTVSGDREIEVGGPDQSEIKGDRTLVIGGAHLRRVGTHDGQSAAVLKETVGAAIVELSRKGGQTTAAGVSKVAIGGVSLEIAGEGKSQIANKGRAEVAGAVRLTKAESISVTVDGTRDTRVGGSLRFEADEKASLSAETTLSLSAKKTVLCPNPAKLVLEVGETRLTIQDGLVDLRSPTITLDIGGVNELAAALSSYK